VGALGGERRERNVIVEGGEPGTTFFQADWRKVVRSWPLAPMVALLGHPYNFLKIYANQPRRMSRLIFDVQKPRFVSRRPGARVWHRPTFPGSAPWRSSPSGKAVIMLPPR